jgi:Asp-tRNA(Asn)/Glu-tRNA(Gln) amidotransferase C subunit
MAKITVQTINTLFADLASSLEVEEVLEELAYVLKYADELNGVDEMKETIRYLNLAKSHLPQNKQ